MTLLSPNFSSNRNGQVRVEYGHGRDISPSTAIVEAIAFIEDVDPMDSAAELGIRLYDQIDPETLDQLINHNKSSKTVTVDLTIHNDNQYSVHIRDTGRLVVEKTIERGQNR